MSVNLDILRRQFIEAGILSGKSSNQILRELQQAGLGIRRQTGLAIIREITAARGLAPPLTRGPLDIPLSPASFQPTEAKYRSDLVVKFRMEIRIPGLAEPLTKFFTRGFSIGITRRDLLIELERLKGLAAEYHQVNISDVEGEIAFAYRTI